MQQGPSALETSRVNLILWGKRFAAEIKAAGAIPAFFTVWPSTARAFDFPRVVESYRLVADSTEAMLLPAGAAWLEAQRLDPSIPLYGPDGFHPSTAGTYLAAVTIFGRLYQRSAVGLPSRVAFRSGTVTIPPPLAATLQQAADFANGR
jgi:hypothetical protein